MIVSSRTETAQGFFAALISLPLAIGVASLALVMAGSIL